MIKIVLVLVLFSTTLFSQSLFPSPQSSIPLNMALNRLTQEPIVNPLIYKLIDNPSKTITEMIKSDSPAEIIKTDIKGPIKSVIIHKCMKYRKRAQYLTSKDLFRKEYYDSSGRQTWDYEADDGDIEDIINYIYDDQGRLQKKVSYDESTDDLEETLIYNYDADGKLSIIQEYDDDGMLDETIKLTHRPNTMIIIEGTYNQVHTRNKKGLLVKYKNFDNSVLDDYETYMYDIDNKLSAFRKVEVDDDGKIDWEKRVNLEYQNGTLANEEMYDRNGSLILNIEYEYSGSNLTKKIAYDQRNNYELTITFSEFDKYDNFTKVDLNKNGDKSGNNVWYEYTYTYYLD